MISVKALRAWIATLSDEDDIGIGEDGLQLLVISNRIDAPYLEVGGTPDEVCEECGAAIFYDDPGTPADNSQHKPACSLYAEPSPVGWEEG